MTASFTKPAIDYTDKDFESLRNAMLELAAYRLPEWTDRSPSDIGMLLIDLFAYVGDVVSYYQDRIASESFLDTAVERRSVLSLLRLIGYELAPPAAASAELTLTFGGPAGAVTTATIPYGAQFKTQATDTAPAQYFTYLGANRTVDLSTPAGRVVAGLPVRHGLIVSQELIGTSNGEPNQSFMIKHTPILLDTLLVEVNEDGAGWVGWDRRANLLYHPDASGAIVTSRPDARDYYVQFDEAGVGFVVFGDGQYGHPPKQPRTQDNVRATYVNGGGSAGNVPAGAIVEGPRSIASLTGVTNPLPAAGGTDGEPIDHAVRFGPLSFRAGDRAVTLSDYVTLAMQAGGVAKVRARTFGWNRVQLYVAPEGNVVTQPGDDLKKRITAYFETRRMVGTAVSVAGPKAVAIDIAVEVTAEHNFAALTVRDQVRQVVAGLLAFSEVDFGSALYLSKVYEAVEALDGVRAVNVTRFRRMDSSAATVRHQALLDAGLDEDLSAKVEYALSGVIARNGRIDIGEIEIPEAGTIDVVVTGGAL